MVNVFIGMETSGKLRRRFQSKGHHAISCDLLPADDDENKFHHQCDVLAALDNLRASGWWPDIAIFHPDCTTHTVSAAWALKDPDYEKYPGVGYHQKVRPETLVGAARRQERARQEMLVQSLMELPIDMKIFENPVSTLGRILGEPSDKVQPFQFGDNASKATCFWAFDRAGNPKVGWRLDRDPKKRLTGRAAGAGMIERWGNQTDNGQNKLSPGDLRWKKRSETFDGIADALVDAALNWKPEPSIFDIAGA